MAEIIDVNTLFGPLPHASSDLNVEALLALMSQNGVTHALTLSTLGMLLDPNVGNAVTRAACQEVSQLLPVATIDPSQFFGDTRFTQQLVSEGYVMVRFFPLDQDWSPSCLPFAEVTKALASTRLPIMVSAERPGNITTLVESLKDYPNPVILSGVSIDSLSELLPALRRYPNWCVETSRLLSMGTLSLIAQTVGAERLLLGTTAPFRSISGAIQTIRYSGLNETEVMQVLGGNAQRLLGRN